MTIAPNYKKILAFGLLPIGIIVTLLACFLTLRPPEPRGIVFGVTFGVAFAYWFLLILCKFKLSKQKKKSWHFLWFPIVFPILMLAAEFANLYQVETKALFGRSILWMHLWSFVILGIELLTRYWHRSLFYCVFSMVLKTVHLAFPAFILSRLLFQDAHFLQDTCVAVWQTNSREALEFLSSNPLLLLFVFLLILFFGTMIMLSLRLRRELQENGNDYHWRLKWGGYLQILGCLILLGFWYLVFIGMRRIDRIQNIAIILQSRQYFADLIRFQEIREKNKQGLPEEITRHIHTTGNDARVIFLLGESHSKCYSSCYGFEIDTTPFLRQLRENNQAIFFQQAYSCQVMTVGVLSRLLTNTNQYQETSTGLVTNSVTMFEVLRHCGYKTTMITNQFAHHPWDTPVAAIGMTADIYRCLSPELAEITRCNPPDGDLISAYTEIEDSARKVTLLHFYAAHQMYLQRLPSKDYHTELKEPYYRALRYVDECVEEVFSRYASSTSPEAVDIIIYLPDHGEHIKLGHDSGNLRTEMVQIPMIIWFSQKYRDAHPELVKKVEEASQKVFTNDLFFDLMLRILGIEHDFSSEEYNILSDRYLLDDETARTVDGKYRLNLTPVSR